MHRSINFAATPVAVAVAVAATKDGMLVLRARDAVCPQLASTQLDRKNVVRIGVRLKPSRVAFGSGRVHVQSVLLLKGFNSVAMRQARCGCFCNVDPAKHYVEGVACFCEARGHLVQRDVLHPNLDGGAVGNQPI